MPTEDKEAVQVFTGPSAQGLQESGQLGCHHRVSRLVCKRQINRAKGYTDGHHWMDRRPYTKINVHTCNNPATCPELDGNCDCRVQCGWRDPRATTTEWAMKPFNKQDDLIYYLTSECEECEECAKCEPVKAGRKASAQRSRDRKRKGGDGGGDSGSSPEKNAKKATAPQGRSATGTRIYDPTKAGA